MDTIAEDCMGAIAAYKGIPREAVTPGSTLESLQLDSLDRVSLSFDLEEKYGVELPEHRLHSVVTVDDLLREVETAVRGKTAAAEGEPQA